MKLIVNGDSRDFSVHTAGDLLNELSIKRERVAIVINEQVVRRAHLDETQLQENDNIEIITMVGGG